MRIDGLERFKGKMKRMPEAMKAELKAAVAKGAEEIVVHQKRLVPVDFGDLQKSITWRWGDEAKIPFSQTMGVYGRTELSAVITAGNTHVRYAHLVEFGSKQHIAGGIYEGANPPVLIPAISPQPFFYPAWRLGKKRAKSRIVRASNKAIKGICQS